MKKLLVLILLLPLHFYAQSIPGYLGKRRVIGFKAQAMPAILTLGRIASEPSFLLRYKSTLDFDYVVSKSSSIGGALELINSTLPSGMFSFNNSISDERINSNELAVRSLNIAFDWKINSRHYSPLGRYTLLQLGVNFISFDDLTTNLDSVSVQGGSAVDYYLGIGYGVNRAITKDIILNAGITFNFNFRGLGLLFGSSSDFIQGSEVEDRKSLEEEAVARIAGGEFVRFHIGISYLF